MDEDGNNRQKKVAGRAKRRRYVQGTRAYTHALTNSVAKRSRTTGKGKHIPDASD